MTTTRTADLATEAKALITAIIEDRMPEGLDPAEWVSAHTRYEGLLARGKWDAAKLSIHGGALSPHFDELKAHAIAEIARFRATLDKQLDAEAAGEFRRLIGSMPYGNTLPNGNSLFFGTGAWEKPLTVRDVLDAFKHLRDEVKAGLEVASRGAATHAQLERDVAAMRRVLGIESK